VSQSKYPEGWGEERVAKVIAHYSEQTEDEAVAEDEAGVQPGEAVMQVPHALVPIVPELIAKRKAQ
jgi:hypothetical protein